MISSFHPGFARVFALGALALAFGGCGGNDSNGAATLAGFDVQAPATVKAGQSVQVTVIARSSTGSPFGGYQGTVKLDTDDVKADVPGPYAFAGVDNGTHAFTLTFKTSGKHSVRALEATSTAQGSQLLDVTAGDPTKLVTVSGDAQGAPVGKPLPHPLVVEALDAFGNGVPGVDVAWATVTNTGKLSAPSVKTDPGGFASNTATLGGYGLNEFTASAAAGSVKLQATALHGDVAALKLDTGDAQSGVVARALGAPLVVRATDATGAPYPGVTVTWTVTAGNGTADGASTTGMDGLAKVTPVLGKAAGANGFAATATSLAPIAFTATGIPDAPAGLVPVSGDGQVGVGGTPLGSPFVAKVVDQYGNGIPGTTVTWTATTGGGSVTPATQATGTDGASTATGTLGASEVADTYAASAAGVPTTLTFAAKRNPYRLVYTDPAAGTVRLVRNAASTDSTVVLDFVVSTAPARAVYSAGFDLPLDAKKVALSATSPIALPATPPLNPGAATPRALSAQLPTKGPLAGNLVAVVSQKSDGDGGVIGDTTLTAGAVLYTVSLSLRADGAPGVVFDGTVAGSPGVTSGGLLNKVGEHVVLAKNVGIGKLEVKP
jgi:hypothetical protein